VESRSGEGSTFFVEVPQEQPGAQATDDPTGRRRTAAPTA
jgi:hypothetical protein